MLSGLLKFGFGGADTPAKALGATMHSYNEDAKKNRKDKEENMKTERLQYTVAKLALLQGYTFSRTGAAYRRDRPNPARPHRQRERKASANRD